MNCGTDGGTDADEELLAEDLERSCRGYRPPIEVTKGGSPERDGGSPPRDAKARRTWETERDAAGEDSK